MQGTKLGRERVVDAILYALATAALGIVVELLVKELYAVLRQRIRPA
jgi:hypothetical protein